MSVVTDQVSRLDAEIDRISATPFLLAEAGGQQAEGEDATEHIRENEYRVASEELSSPRAKKLLRIFRSLSTSTSSSSQPLLPAWQVKDLLLQTDLVGFSEVSSGYAAKASHGHYESELEWLVLGKATVQTYGLILNTFLDQIVPLSEDMWYWDQVLSSYTYSGLYTVQLSPLRVWAWTKDIYRDSRLRFRQFQASSNQTEHIRESLSERWQQFYSIVRGSIHERSLINVRNKVFSPVALSRRQARSNLKQLRKLRAMTASGMGLLLDEGLSFGVGDDDSNKSDFAADSADHEWKGVVERSVALMDMVLRDVSTLSHSISDFEEKVFAGVEDDPELSAQADPADRTSMLARRLVDLLEVQLPSHVAVNQKLVRQYGRPSRLVRYWLPGLALFLSSSTILRVLVNRKADIINWMQDLGNTAKDFWFNWVIEPVRKIIGTIRHDENSEIAIMSRDSLKADRDSLERMVVEFAKDKPDLAVGASSLTETQLEDIRLKVKEGDVTPVLKAYERDLRNPFVGAIRGDLVRALLIQVQKTKVDLEVAMSGIDSLLKSQELVFGMIGLTPGVLVTITTFSYLKSVSGGRKGMRRSQRGARSIRVLRSIDRILSEAVPTQNNLLSYKDHGLLVCEVHVLRNLVHGLLPGEVERDFLEDLEDLVSLKAISIQQRALDRIRWTYSRWLNH
ncbi:ATP synthase regulation protein NCA2 [Coniochaeta hoffmannii]|uniref:ATP synthase regulation protein NCA2 n=1 Tax=Coniochaeta hoffmannii TaxID=91930 RepID=A0AA38VNI9_9PEZI|nr:ATP synthase regulation protein NCA2 [Coniochaeta hoffmannii]